MRYTAGRIIKWDAGPTQTLTNKSNASAHGDSTSQSQRWNGTHLISTTDAVVVIIIISAESINIEHVSIIKLIHVWLCHTTCMVPEYYVLHIKQYNSNIPFNIKSSGMY
jgi:hypothetical protein